MSPLHLFAPVIKSALKARWRPWRIVLFAVVSVYDGIYRNIMRCSLTSDVDIKEEVEKR